MTTITAQVIADSVGQYAPRLTTVLCRYPLVIHNEVMTHRDFSRGAASSRAVPVSKLIQSVIDDPYIPLKWYKNIPGMAGQEELTGSELRRALNAYKQAMDDAIYYAGKLADIGAHKQIVNRIIGPYSHITTLITATRWSNFFHTRCHLKPDGEPSAEYHMYLLACAIQDAMAKSTPKLLQPGEWHLPFTEDSEFSDTELDFNNRLKQSVARCASTSYKTVDGFDMTLDRAIALHDKLVAADPMHASPAEHQAKVDTWIKRDAGWIDGRCGNLAPGWVQYRKTLPGECR